MKNFTVGQQVKFITLGYNKEHPYFRWDAEIVWVDYDEVTVDVKFGDQVQRMYCDRKGVVTGGGTHGWIE